MENEKNKKATQEGADLEMAAREYGNDLSHDSCEQAFLDGAKWMLEHPTGGELLHVCNKTAEITKKKMIEKACEWLRTNYEDIGIRYIRGHKVEDEIESFKKAMEERK